MLQAITNDQTHHVSTTRLSTLDSRLSLLGPFGPSPHLAVALSGGADSMALTLLAHGWVQAYGGRITTLTVDHGLRPESRTEAEQVAAWMQARGIAHHILTPPHTAVSNNLQEAARSWRYDALADWCRAHDVLHCLLAHHAGDQRETATHHLSRGRTADGPSGMAALRNYRGVRFLRPLLGVEKNALKGYLQTHEICWVEDSSNADPRFARVRIRQALTEDAAHLAELNTQIRREGEARAARDHAFAEAAMRCITLYPEGRAELALPYWRTLAPDLDSQLIADLLTTLSGLSRRPRWTDTKRITHALRHPDSEGMKRTLHRCLLHVTGDTLHITREPIHAQSPFAPAKPLAAAPFWWLKDSR